MSILATTRTIAWQMTPSWDHVIKCAVRMCMGAGLMLGASMLHEAIAPWATFGGKLFVMLAIIGLFGHAEGVFAAHVSAKIQKETARLAVVGVAAISMLTIGARDEREDDMGMG